MAQLSILAGATSQSINVFIQDSSSTIGAGLSGLVFNTGSLAAYYSFSGATTTAVSITLATLATVTTAWSSGGFIEIDATHMKGWYRLDIPNAALATSKGRSVALHLYGATNMAPCPVMIELTGWDNQNANSGGLAVLPASAVPGAAGGLFIAGTNAATTVTTSLTTTFTGNLTGSVGSVTGAVGSVTGAVGSVTGLTNATIATAVWQDSTAGDFTTASSIGKSLYTAGIVPGGSGGLFIAGTNAATTITTSLTTTFIGNLTGSVATVTGAVGSVTALTGAIIATAVWQDATAGDFTTASSIGKSLYNAFTSNTSVFTTASLVNAPTGGSAPTTAQIATAVWEDILVGGDFNTSGSIGLLLRTGVPNAAPGAINGIFIAGTNAATTVSGAFTSTFTGNLTGSVGSVAGNVSGNVVGSTASVTAPVILTLSQTLNAARALDAIADTSLTLNDALHSAIADAAGKESVSGTVYLIQTPFTGTTIRTFALNSGSTPTQRS